MTTGWLLLLLLVVSSQSVDSQTTDDGISQGGDRLNQQQGGAERIPGSPQHVLRLLLDGQRNLTVRNSGKFTPPNLRDAVADPRFAKGGHGERVEREPKGGSGGIAPSGVPEAEGFLYIFIQNSG